MGETMTEPKEHQNPKVEALNEWQRKVDAQRKDKGQQPVTPTFVPPQPQAAPVLRAPLPPAGPPDMKG